MNDHTFETHVRRLYRQITNGGIDKLNQEGFRVRGISDFERLPRKALKILPWLSLFIQCSTEADCATNDRSHWREGGC
jgi:hypothetical protein